VCMVSQLQYIEINAYRENAAAKFTPFIRGSIPIWGICVAFVKNVSITIIDLQIKIRIQFPYIYDIEIIIDTIIIWGKPIGNDEYQFFARVNGDGNRQTDAIIATIRNFTGRIISVTINQECGVWVRSAIFKIIIPNNRICTYNIDGQISNRWSVFAAKLISICNKLGRGILYNIELKRRDAANIGIAISHI